MKMAVDQPRSSYTGRPVELPNGHAKSGTKTQQSSIRPVVKAPQRGYVNYATSLLLRLAVWYSIVTFLFRCPADVSQLSNDTPRICKPYLQLQATARPYIKPYYDTHVQPHVAKVKPYIDHAQQRYVQPATTFANTNYAKYGAPQVAKAQKYGEAQWHRVVVPQSKLAAAQVHKQYQVLLAPHVQKVDDIARPYYQGISNSASDLWELELQPAYEFVSPYIHKSYQTTEQFVTTIAIPYSQWANGILWTSVNRHVLPTLRILYGENVEPQVVRIRQRLGRYRDDKKIESGASSIVSESSTVTAIATAASLSSTNHPSQTTMPPASTTASLSTSIDAAPVEDKKTPSELFSQDLTKWEKQTTKAVHDGIDHLRDRIKEIIATQTNKQLKLVGESHIVQLEVLYDSGIKTLRTKIRSLAKDLPEEATDEDTKAALARFEEQVRAVGKQVREKAQHIRSWKKAVEVETSSLVEAAANSTLETVDNIRELRLQEIGRRWAADNEITHKDWSRYNELKRTSGKLRQSVVDLIDRDTALLQFRDAGADIEERAMAIAQDAAAELNRLKGVASWKLRARDDSDDFGDRIIPAAAARLSSQAAEAVSQLTQSVMGSTQGTIESVTSRAKSQASEAAENFASAATEVSDAVRASATSVSESIISPSLAAAVSAASRMSEDVRFRPHPIEEDLHRVRVSLPGKPRMVPTGAASIISETASKLASSVSDKLSSASTEAEKTIDAVSSSVTSAAYVGSASIASAAGVSTPTLSRVSSAAESVATSMSSAVADAVNLNGDASPASIMSEGVERAARSVSDAAATATKRVFAGAMAQAVPSQQPILDEDLDADDESTFDSAMHAGWEQVASMTSALHDAIHGTQAGQSTKVAESVYQSAFTAISNVFYGTESTDKFNKKFASQKYDEAVSAAAAIIYGTSTSAAQSISSVAGSSYNDLSAQANAKYSEALSYASVQSVAAKSMVSAKISGTPKPIYEQMLASVESAYADSASLAKAKLQLALSYTGAVVPTQAPLASVSSVASLRLAEGLSRASAQFSSLKSSAGLAPTPAYQSLSNAAQRQYYEGIGFAYDQYSSYVSSASRAIRSAKAQITPAPTPAYQSLLGAAQIRYASASAAAAAALESALNAASSAAGMSSTSPAQSVLSAANDQYSSALAGASSLLYGTQTPVYEAYMSAASARYSDLAADAAYRYESLSSAAFSAAGAATTGNSVLADAVSAASSQYEAALAAAAAAFGKISQEASDAVYGSSTNQVQSASSALSAFLYGTEVAWTENVASAASQNWEAIVSAASEKVYGQPTPVYASVTDQAYVAAAQVTSAAGQQYDAVSSLFASLVSGKDADFTDRVFDQLSSAYYTGAVAAASSASSAAASVYSDASSAITAVFTPPATVEDIISSISSQLDAAVDAASRGVYGTQAGTYEKATAAAVNAANDAASSASSVASVISSSLSTAVYGTPAPYMSQAQSAADDALGKISAALFATKPTATWPDFLGSTSSTQIPVTDRIAALQAAVVANARAAGISATEYMHQFSLSARPDKNRAQTLKERYDMSVEQTKAFQETLLEGAQNSGSSLVSYVQRLREEVKAQEAADQSRIQQGYESAKSVAGSGYDSASSAVNNAASSISSLVFGPEKTGAMESASKRIAEAMASARSKIEEYQASAASAAGQATKVISDSAVTASSKLESIARSVKDEL